MNLSHCGYWFLPLTDIDPDLLKIWFVLGNGFSSHKFCPIRLLQKLMTGCLTSLRAIILQIISVYIRIMSLITIFFFLDFVFLG